MMLDIPLLSPADLYRIRSILAGAEWIDGNATSGAQSALAKRNRQLGEEMAAAREAGAILLDALAASPLFVAAALPLKVYPPLFNAYAGGEAFGTHVDTAIRIRRGSDFRLRSDLSATLFLADPETYQGGELVIEDRSGDRKVKLAAGHLALYPSSSLHHVAPVTRGERLAGILWIQSMVRDDSDRRLLFELDSSIQALGADRGQEDREIIRLTGLYHNLLRRWADA
ncbi:MAG: 2OG-Fe(II) oxygenase [Alphaproteobacteria bacterium]|nr:2OG-Fe(II) oxygenase [Alphaproteobacteria bacterium]